VKIRPEHLKHLSDILKPLDTQEMRDTYRTSGLTPRRYRWDLTYSKEARAHDLSNWLCKNIYPYANDEHLDTALRAIICDDQWKPAVMAKEPA
jgi:hypothetical protein